MSQKINVDVTPGGIMPLLYFSQNDVGRQFQVALVSSDGYEIPSGATVKLQATKPSGFGFSVEADSVTNGVATFTTTATMTDEYGRFPAEIQITDGDDVIYSANFIMVGEKNPHPDGTIDGSEGSIVPELTLLVERVEAAAESIHDLTVSATTLAAGSNATATYDDATNNITFGIPKGADGTVTEEQLDAAVSDLKSDLSEKTRNLNTSKMGRWGNSSDGNIYSRDDKYYGMESFIPVTAGQTYYVSFGGITSSSAISWTYLFVNDGGTNLARSGYSDIAGHSITAPTGATKLNVFCKSDNTITVSDSAYIQIEKGSRATAHIPAISATDYIVREIVDKAFQIYAVIDDSADLDALTKTGAYRWNSTSVPDNAPEEQAGRLINILSDANSQTGTIQLAMTTATTQKLFMRYRATGGWGAWIELASKAYVDDIFSAITINDGAEWEA